MNTHRTCRRLQRVCISLACAMVLILITLAYVVHAYVLTPNVIVISTTFSTPPDKPMPNYGYDISWPVYGRIGEL